MAEKDLNFVAEGCDVVIYAFAEEADELLCDAVRVLLIAVECGHFTIAFVIVVIGKSKNRNESWAFGDDMIKIGLRL